MEGEMTPARIANSILLDAKFDGQYLLVEGAKDLRLYRKFIREELRVKATFGKYALREVYEILERNQFNKVLGIRDADFLRIPNNPKFDPNYVHPIFVTDNHDSEVMMIDSKALTDFLNVVSDPDKVNKFERKVGKSVRDLLYELGYNIGCLKLANKRNNLGLVFKPAKIDGNVIKYKKFICDKTFVFLGNDELITAALDYSRNRNTQLASKPTILEALGVILAENHDIKEIVNGHDLSEILYLIVTKGLGSNSSVLNGADSIENSLIMSYDIAQFAKTRLYNSLDSYQKTKGVSIM